MLRLPFKIYKYILGLIVFFWKVNEMHLLLPICYFSYLKSDASQKSFLNIGSK